jgi:4-diphosphocytidyl-2-C-methyl-D-erythritol kinase
MKPLVAEAPGKVNLCLFVGRPRDDGYHPLVSVFQSVSLTDHLLLEAAPGDHDEVICAGVQGPNLAARAIEAYRTAARWDGPPLRLTIDKRIPVAAGMGGGSADAAAALRLIAHAAGRPDDPLVRELAPRLGADVPSQVTPGRALVTGIGEHVEPLPPGPPAALLIVPSTHELSTPDVYREADRLGLTRTSLEECEARVRGGELPYVNDLQDAARSLCPSIDAALAAVTEAGAGAALVSGSGPTVLGIFDDVERARAAARTLPQALVATACAPGTGAVREYLQGES